MRERPRMRAGVAKKNRRQCGQRWARPGFCAVLGFCFFCGASSGHCYCTLPARHSSDSTGVGGDVQRNHTRREWDAQYCRAQRLHSAVAGAPQRPCAAPIDSVLTARTRTGSQSHTTCGGSRHAHPTSCAEGATTHSGASCHTWTWFGRAHVPMCALRVPASCHLCPRRCRPCRRGTWP